jgi:hypothetical protein
MVQVLMKHPRYARIDNDVHIRRSCERIETRHGARSMHASTAATHADIDILHKLNRDCCRAAA